MTVIIQPKLREWARRELAGYKYREIARKANISASRVVDLLVHDDRRIGHDVCEKLARFTRTPVHNVFEMAELLPRTPEQSSAVRYLAYIYENLDERAKKDLIAFAEHLRDRHKQDLP